MKTLLRKRRLVLTAQMNQLGMVAFDRAKLPASARFITGLQAFGKGLAQLTGYQPTATDFYFGAVSDSSVANQGWIGLLTKQAYPTGQTSAQFTVSAGIADRVFYAHPAALPTPTIVYLSYPGGFLDEGLITVQTSTGPVAYRVWGSKSPGLGAGVQITVTH